MFASAATCFTLPTPLAAAQGNSGNHGHGHGHGNDDDQGHGYGHGNDDDQGHGHGKGKYKHQNKRYFRDQDRDYVIRYYDGPRNLPPGLRKKYYRNGTLPPGWQKRFRPMPPVLIQELPPVPYGYQRGYYDGYAVVVDPRTRIIYDAIDIIGALSSR
ncbi:MAG: hypothetical protein BGO25_12290 [Acidobacteriales bacterium 59-55]|nr:MAG: hypothetical protein BGO25_12290 [Acidobacteriales bacterium 59-55]